MSGGQRLALGDVLRCHRQTAELTQAELAERTELSRRGSNDLERLGDRQVRRLLGRSSIP